MLSDIKNEIKGWNPNNAITHNTYSSKDTTAKCGCHC